MGLLDYAQGIQLYMKLQLQITRLNLDIQKQIKQHKSNIKDSQFQEFKEIIKQLKLFVEKYENNSLLKGEIFKANTMIQKIEEGITNIETNFELKDGYWQEKKSDLT